ncbi:TetR/AcrR family transcriptional regulator [Kribbella sp. NPDC004536]|uniref:TetR/AcrR family transcriptional regulator n=1 Tax=Kribbella sp. NPDC004536 TaxID=3364106 RepID=UPI003687813F
MTGRERQKQRTRSALVEAYNELVRQGHSPNVAQVAEAAQVSVATAYRYFPNPESLRADAAVAAARTQPDFAALLDAAGDDPVVRIEVLVRAIARWQLNDEPVWRGVLRATLERWFAQHESTTRTPTPAPARSTTTAASTAAAGGAERAGGTEGGIDVVPVRSTAREDVVRLALRSLEAELSPAGFRQLVNTVMLTCGVEALIATRDAAGLDPHEAEETMVAAARTLVAAALKRG